MRFGQLSAAKSAGLLILASLGLSHGQVSPYSISSDDAIKKTASTIAWDMLQYYKGNASGGTPGVLPGPPPVGDYYWWESGAMWGTMIDYWHLTGDSSYNELIMSSLLYHTGPNKDFMNLNYTLSLGNDDQAFWGFSAMLAAETNFPNPPTDKPQWLALAQGVFNTQASPLRQDLECGGGLHWQIFQQNSGYTYKNTIANACFFNLGARLARYTGNQTYSDWAVKTWDWLWAVGYIEHESWAAYDGARTEHNCTDFDKAEFSYNNAILLQGAAYMYNFTNGNADWKKRIDGLLGHGLTMFFRNESAYEPPCEETDNGCKTDQFTFKGFLHRFWSTVAQMAPYTAEKIQPVLRKSAQAAIAQCTGGALGRQCGFKWSKGVYDPHSGTGVGQQMSALAAVSSLLMKESHAAVTNSTGGTSKGDPNAGSDSYAFVYNPRPITTADKAGAGILTGVFVLGTLAFFGWIAIGG